MPVKAYSSVITMAAGHCLVFFILLISSTGFSVEDTVYVETGASVHLNVQKEKLPDEFDDFTWMNEKSQTIVKYYKKFQTVNDDYKQYKGRVQFNTETFSLILNNMQKNDSGVYTARISGSKYEDITKHKVSVIDAVKPPVLTIISKSYINYSCTVNFTCKGHDITLTSTYNNGSCSPEEVTSQVNTLSLICRENSIICNHSNPISWKNHTADLKPFCKENKEEIQDRRSPPYIVIGCVCALVILAVFVLLGICQYRKRHKGGQQDINTLYEGAGVQLTETMKTDSHTYDVPDRSSSEKQEKNGSVTIYHTVGQPPNLPVTAVTDHTIYSQVCKQPPAKSPETSSSNNSRNKTQDCE